jgi:hypothetical protein
MVPFQWHQCLIQDFSLQVVLCASTKLTESGSVPKKVPDSTPDSLPSNHLVSPAKRMAIAFAETQGRRTGMEDELVRFISLFFCLFFLPHLIPLFSLFPVFSNFFLVLCSCFTIACFLTHLG